MSALLRAEQVARAAQLQIAHGNAEAGAELRELADGVQTLLRRFGKHLAWAHREIRIRQTVGTSDTSAHLIQLSQTEVIRVVNNQRVRHRDIQSRLNDCRTQQNVKLLLAEIEHDVFQRMLAHLPMCDGDSRFRHELGELAVALFD